MNVKKLLLALTILILAALACSLGTSAPGTEAAPSGETDSSGDGDSGSTGDSSGDDSGSTGDESTDSGSTDADSGGQGGLSLAPGEPLDLDNPALYSQPVGFNTYRTTLDYTYSTTDSITGTVFLRSTLQLEPYATSLEAFTYGAAAAGNQETFTITQVLGTQYIITRESGCMSGPAGVQANPFEVALDTGGILTGEAAYKGEEFINGVDTFVYTLTLENVNPSGATGTEIRELSEGLVYIAQDGGFFVRLYIEGKGVNELLGQDPDRVGDLVYDLNFFDFNQPVDIRVPPGCVGTGDEESLYPMPEDANNVSQFGDIMTFSTGLSMADAAAFYEAEMPAYGCSAPQVVGDGSSSTSMTFNDCDFGAVQILLVPEDANTTLVSILPTTP